MYSKYALYFVAILLSALLSFILVNRLSKYVKAIAKHKYVAYITAFFIIYLGTLKLFSVFYPEFMEHYQDLLEHISIPSKFQTKPTTSIDTSIFQQKQITPSTTTVVSAPVDAVKEIPVAYVDPTPPPPDPVYGGYTGSSTDSSTGFTGFTAFTGYADYGFVEPTSGYTGYTGSSEVVVVAPETGFTGYTESESSEVVMVSPESGYTAAASTTGAESGYTGGNVQFDMGNMGALIPLASSLLTGLLAKQPQVNVNVFNDGDDKVRVNGYPTSSKYNMDNCLKKPTPKSNRQAYNYRTARKPRSDYWRSRIDRDSDYVLMDQNRVNRMYNNPRSSSCPVCPLDINYPFAAYRSGR